MSSKTSHKETLKELKKFSIKILELGSPILDDRIEKFESQIGHMLPDDFKFFLENHNSFSLGGSTVYGLGDEFRGASLDKIYQFEHFQAENPMPEPLLPFSPDGAGNHYCLDLESLSNGITPVLFWQHDLDYSKSDIEITNESFTDWVNKVLIGWTLEEYNYNGSEK